MNYFLEKEIQEQAPMLRAQAQHWTESAAALREQFADRKDLVVLGRGSSGNACIFLSYLWGLQTGKQAVEFRPWLAANQYEEQPDWSDSKVFAYSVSGRSTDIALAAQWLRDRGAKVLGVTNSEEEASATHIGRASDALMRLRAGEEHAVPATKTFIAQLFSAAALSGLPIADAAEESADCFEEVLNSDRASMLAEFIRGARQVAWLARGPAMATALDSALKLQETAGIPSTGYSSAEFLHGPVGAFGKEDRAIIFIDGDAPFDNHDTVLATLLSRETPVLIIGRQKGGEQLRGSSLPVPLPEPVWARGSVLVLLAQQASFLEAVRQGRNPDAPMGLNKVTQT